MQINYDSWLEQPAAHKAIVKKSIKNNIYIHTYIYNINI